MVPPASVRLGVADSVSVAVSSSTIVVVTDEVPVSCRLSKLPPLADTSCTVTVSLPSARLSFSVGTLKLALDAPAGIVTVATPVKSLPSAALPL